MQDVEMLTVYAHFTPMDTISMVRNLIHAHCSKRKLFRIGSRLNHSAIARVMEVDVSTVNRIMNLDPGRRPESAPKEWYPDAVTIAGLMRLTGHLSPSELWRDIEDAPPAPPPNPTARKRRRLH